MLGELAEAVRDLRRETDEERRERVDDLAVLIDLITTGWQGLDARLGRIERQVSRLEAGRREPLVIAPARIAPPPVEPAAAAPVEPAEPGGRGKLPIVATLALVGAAIATLAVLQLASGGPDVSRLVALRESAPTTATGEASSTTSRAPTSTRAETRPAATPAPPPATTSDVLPTTAGATTRPKPPVATSPKTVSTPPAATTRPATTAASPPGFQPTRNWAWAPVKDADYYEVVFTRSGKLFYRGSPTEPRLTLPSSVVFRPGAYRWVVRPGFGERAAESLGAPVVDSPFTVG